MSILKVARMGHPVLRRRARPVEKREIADPAFQKLIDDMVETMHEYAGVGLAGPQVHDGRRVFVAQLEEDGEVLAFVNPTVTPLDDEIVEGWEGCLSIPEIRGLVPRALRVRIEALDRQGRAVRLEATDFPARVVQHETDHLDGILFLDRMRSLASLTYMEEYARYHARAD